MASNKLVTSKEAALGRLKLEMKAIEELSSKVNSQINRLGIEELEIDHRIRPNTANTTCDPNINCQVSSEIPVELENQQINETNLNLSMTAALELGNNSNYEDSSEIEDST